MRVWVCVCVCVCVCVKMCVIFLCVVCRFDTLSGKKIAVFGFAFKKNTGDVRLHTRLQTHTDTFSRQERAHTYRRACICTYMCTCTHTQTRESPAIYICQHLIGERAKVAIFDPKVHNTLIHTEQHALTKKHAYIHTHAGTYIHIHTDTGGNRADSTRF